MVDIRRYMDDTKEKLHVKKKENNGNEMKIEESRKIKFSYGSKFASPRL